MTVLVVHNFYQQPGGEDQVFADEIALLESAGHTVIRYTVDNDDIVQMNPVALAANTIWSRSGYRTLFNLVRQHNVEVAHFHNTFPLLSPAAYYGARRAGAAVVQTLHNYRLLCPASTFYRDGHVCEECLGRSIAWPAVLHKCYRASRGTTATAVAMLAWHRARGTYGRQVDTYIALSEFAANKFVQAGFSREQIVVKPNFVNPDPGIGTGAGDERGPYALFIGRLTATKGIATLLQAWRQLKTPLRLKIIGDGELADDVRAAAAADSRIEYLARQASPQVYALLRDAALLVFPSVWYEGMPKTIIEAFASGTPVLASSLGTMTEMIDDTCGGLFNPGDAGDLADRLSALVSSERLAALRPASRRRYETLYTAPTNLLALQGIYASAIAKRNANPDRAAGRK